MAQWLGRVKGPVNIAKVATWLAVVSVVALVGWGYSTLEWEEEVIDLGFSPEARQNPFLAAQRFLQSQDIEVKHHTSVFALDALPRPADATLVLAGSRQALGAHRAQRLWTWVESGGHLVTDAQAMTDPVTGETDDVILQRLGLRHYSQHASTRRPDHEEESMSVFLSLLGQRRALCENAEGIVEFQVGDQAAPLQIQVHSDGWLMDAEELALASAGREDEGTQFVQFEVGQGLVSVFTDLRHWSNRHVECYDHAFLLWYLVGVNPQAWFVYSNQLPSLPRLIWQQAPLVVVLSVCLLVLWLWRRGRRFGPLVVGDVRRRRSLLEHVHASALFQWRLGQWASLLDDLRLSIRQHMVQRHHGFQRLSAAEQHALIARLADVDEQQVAWALGAEALSDKRHFVKAVQLLQRIRNAL